MGWGQNEKFKNSLALQRYILCTYVLYMTYHYANDVIALHSLEIRGFCSTKCSSEMLQNLLYFMYKKTHVVFFVFHFVQLYIFTL